MANEENRYLLRRHMEQTCRRESADREAGRNQRLTVLPVYKRCRGGRAEQVKWYDRFVGGAIGVGLEKNILDGYKFLAQQYAEGDEVYVLGFSRGAYTAPSLVGLIRNCGLVKNKQLALRVAMALSNAQ